MKKKVIDASNKKLGRVATEAAMALMGKDSPDYKPNKVADVQVEIINADAMDISSIKKEDKYYLTVSGYPGGQKKEKLGALMDRRGAAEALKRAIKGMLPDNKLKAKTIINLKITA